MATLDEKFLDGKAAGYCSSSEGEEEPFRVVNDEDEHQANVMRQMGGGAGNTGPKGVLNDYERFKEESKRQRAAKDRLILKEAQRGMLQSSKEDRKRMEAEADLSDEEAESIESLREKRLREMRKALAGKMVEATHKDEYTKAIDTSGNNLLAVLIYEPDNEASQRLSHICKVLAADYPKVKFMRARSALLGMSKNFTEQALPTLQFFLNGNLVGNFVQMTSLIGQDYTADKLRKFLRKQHISLDRAAYLTDSEYSTDEDLD